MPPDLALERYRPTRLWRQMTPDQRLDAARAFWADGDSSDQQAEAVVAIAKQMKFRPKSVASLPSDRKAKYLAGLSLPPEPVAGRLMVAFHLEHRRPMMAAFLDAVGITHDNGLITEESPKAPAPERLQSAARSLVSTHGREEVRLYFGALVSQDPETWGGLAEVLEAEG